MYGTHNTALPLYYSGETQVKQTIERRVSQKWRHADIGLHGAPFAKAVLPTDVR